MIYNEGYAEIFGDRHLAAEGENFFDLWSEIRGVFEPLARRVYAGKSVYVDNVEEQQNRTGQSEEAHFHFTYTPLQHESNEIPEMFCVYTETTKENMLRRELEQEPNRQGQMFEVAPSFIAMLKRSDHVFELDNPDLMSLAGHRDNIGNSATNALLKPRSQGYIDMLDAVVSTSKAIRIDGAKVVLQRVAGGRQKNGSSTLSISRC